MASRKPSEGVLNNNILPINATNSGGVIMIGS